MTSRHELTTSTFRPEPAELTNASAHLPQGKTMDGFLRACLRTLAEDPQTLIELVSARWPADKPRGRPRKTHTSDKEKPGQALVLLTVGDVAHVATALHHHTAPLKVPAARIAEQAGLPEDELPGRRFRVETVTPDRADGFTLLHDPRV